MNHLFRFIATGFYSGYVPYAPGTVGSVLACVILWLIPGLRDFFLFLLIVGVFFIGVWASTQVEKTDGRDASIINIDEIVGMWLSFLFLPERSYWFWFVGAFFLFRCFDVFKPFPVKWFQSLPKGWGVMMDDVLAGLYTNLSLHLVYLIFVG